MTHVSASVEPELIGLVMRKVLNQCEAASTSKLIGIEGTPVSGKTVMAKALSEALENAQLIDMASLITANSTLNSIDLPDLLADKTTYIIDESEYCDQEELAIAIKSALDKACAVILFFQSGEGLSQEVRDQMQHFKLTQAQGLTKLKTH